MRQLIVIIVFVHLDFIFAEILPLISGLALLELLQDPFLLRLDRFELELFDEKLLQALHSIPYRGAHFGLEAGFDKITHGLGDEVVIECCLVLVLLCCSA